MFEPITTSRLLLRQPTWSDLDALLERRNDPLVAKYQDWPVPFTGAAAHRLLTNVTAMGGPQRNEWWMLTVSDRHRPEVPLGDLALHLCSNGSEAEIGYTFAAVSHGRGYATEAVAALVDYLFDDVGVKRATASLHPDNIASAMVLERTGFEFEGRTQMSHWAGEGDDAVYSDVLYYGLTEQQHRHWQNRLTAPPNHVGLVEITSDNHYEVARLRPHKSQERLVSSVWQSYGDALYPEIVNGAPFAPWLRAIEADGELAGFVMLATQTEAHPNPYLWRLLIDRTHQRRGIGNRALDLVEDECRGTGATAIEVSWEEGRGSPAPFYEARGYVRTGNIVDGETEAIKPL